MLENIVNGDSVNVLDWMKENYIATGGEYMINDAIGVAASFFAGFNYGVKDVTRAAFLGFIAATLPETTYYVSEIVRTFPSPDNFNLMDGLNVNLNCTWELVKDYALVSAAAYVGNKFGVIFGHAHPNNGYSRSNSSKNNSSDARDWW